MEHAPLMLSVTPRRWDWSCLNIGLVSSVRWTTFCSRELRNRNCLVFNFGLDPGFGFKTPSISRYKVHEPKFASSSSAYFTVSFMKAITKMDMDRGNHGSLIHGP